MEEQVYITVDGRENGKKWIDVSSDPNAAFDVADILCFILEELSTEQQKKVYQFATEIKSKDIDLEIRPI